jgi:hypothetical protein
MLSIQWSDLKKQSSLLVQTFYLFHWLSERTAFFSWEILKIQIKQGYFYVHFSIYHYCNCYFCTLNTFILYTTVSACYYHYCDLFVVGLLHGEITIHYLKYHWISIQVLLFSYVVSRLFCSLLGTVGTNITIINGAMIEIALGKKKYL